MIYISRSNRKQNIHVGGKYPAVRFSTIEKLGGTGRGDESSPEKHRRRSPLNPDVPVSRETTIHSFNQIRARAHNDAKCPKTSIQPFKNPAKVPPRASFHT